MTRKQLLAQIKKAVYNQDRVVAKQLFAEFPMLSFQAFNDVYHTGVMRKLNRKSK